MNEVRRAQAALTHADSGESVGVIEVPVMPNMPEYVEKNGTEYVIEKTRFHENDMWDLEFLVSETGN